MDNIMEEYYGVFPTVLFSCSDDRTKMHFVLSLKQSSVKQTDDIIKLMRHCGAEVSLDLEEATNHSAVIVDHKEVVRFHGPVFKLSYIQDCFDALQLLNIDKYRQSTTKHICKDVDSLQVVFFRRESWDNLITQDQRSWIDKNSSSAEKAGSSLIISKTTPDRPKLRKRVDEKSPSKENPSSLEEVSNTPDIIIEHNSDSLDARSVKEINNEDSNFRRQTRNTNKQDFLDKETNNEKNNYQRQTRNSDKHSRQPYTKQEKINILKYIVERNEYGKVRGRQLWMDMERRKICSSRTWQSMKEHFIKKIVCDLEAYPFLTKEETRKLKAC